jgi:molybdate transport system substrate-binding protein
MFRSSLFAAVLAAALSPAFGEAAEIKVLSANGMREVMEDLGPKFERATGHKLTILFGTLGVLVQRVLSGEAADAIVTPRQGIDRLVSERKATEDVTTIARSGIGVIVRKGATKPDISTPDELRKTLLAAKSVTHLDPAAGGTTGPHFMRVMERLGIADQMKPKIVLHPNARAAGELVAKGEAEIGVNLVQELLPLPGIEVVGPLPGDLQLTLTFAAATLAGAKEPAAAKALIEFLRTPEAAAVIKSKGMEPS